MSVKNVHTTHRDGVIVYLSDEFRQNQKDARTKSHTSQYTGLILFILSVIVLIAVYAFVLQYLVLDVEFSISVGWYDVKNTSSVTVADNKTHTTL